MFFCYRKQCECLELNSEERSKVAEMQIDFKVITSTFSAAFMFELVLHTVFIKMPNFSLRLNVAKFFLQSDEYIHILLMSYSIITQNKSGRER